MNDVKSFGIQDSEITIWTDVDGVLSADPRLVPEAVVLDEMTYHEAADNVERNGAMCAHPRTGAPIENPYLKIRASQGAVLAKMRHIKGDRALQALNDTAPS